MPTTYNDASTTYNQSSLSYTGDAGSLANLPSVAVYVAFDTVSPYDVLPVWTEITTYVRDMSIRRGRTDDLQRFAPAEATLVLDNNQRLFDPTNSASIYSGKLTARKQIKVEATWGSTTYTVFRGFISDWPVEWTVGGKDSTVSINCFDIVSLLATETTPIDWLTKITTAYSPNAYIKCNDSQGGTVLADTMSGGVKYLQNYTPATRPNFFETDPIAPASPNHAAYCAWYRNVVPFTDDTTPTGIIIGNECYASISFWIKGTGETTSSYNSLTVTYRAGDMGFSISGAGAMIISTSIYGISSSSPYDVDTTYVPNFSLPVHVFWQRSPSTGHTVWLNGKEATLTPRVSGSGSAASTYGLTLDIKRANVQEVALWTRTNFTTADVNNIYRAGAGRITESTLSRMNRILDNTRISSTLRNFTSSPVANVSEIPNGQTAMAHILSVVESEGGELFASLDGSLVFLDRDYFVTRSRSINSQVTFTDNGVGVGYDKNRVQVAFDVDRLRNSVNVQFSGGGVIGAVDQASVSTYGAADETINTLLDSPVSAFALADRKVSLFNKPKLRVGSFMVRGQEDPDYNWDKILNLDVLDRITFVRTPVTGSSISKEMLVQAIEHRISPALWETTIQASTRMTNWFIIGKSLIGGEDLLY